MTAIIFSLTCALIIYLSYRISHNTINIVSVFTVPYMLIIPINNLFMIHRGFFAISDQVIFMIAGSIVCISIGYILANICYPISQIQVENTEQMIDKRLLNYKVESMLKYVLFVETIVLLRFLFIVVTRGVTYIGSGKFDGYMTSGLAGHLFLTIYPLIPFLFLHWLKHKRQAQYLIATLMCVILLFTTIVKYHSIGMAVLLYFFTALEDKKYVRKGLIIVCVAAVSLFVLNYFFQFFTRGTISRVAQDYYINHLWNYMGGSLIHDNLIFTTGVNVEMSLLYKYARVILTPFVVLLNAIFGVQMEPINRVKNPLRYELMGTNGEIGNVVDAFGYFFPSKGHLLEIVFNFILLLIIGFLFSILFNISVQKRSKMNISISVLLVFFCFFSFFGTFYTLLPPWEILVYSFVLPKLFDRRIVICFKK